MKIKTYKESAFEAWETKEEREKLCEIANQLDEIADYIQKEHPNFDYLTSGDKTIGSVTFFAMRAALKKMVELPEWRVVEIKERWER